MRKSMERIAAGVATGFILLLAGCCPYAMMSFVASATGAPVNPSGGLIWETNAKTNVVKAGTAESNFTFALSNTATTNIVIKRVVTSCGCTVAKLPSEPWTIKPGESASLEITMDVGGKQGTVTKNALVEMSSGYQNLRVTTTIQEDSSAVATTPGMRLQERAKNIMLAQADRQAVFHGTCASCHAEKSADKTGAELYSTACGICHDAETRASLVPDLRKLPHETNRNYWQQWITYGKPGTMMPAFDRSEGGPLTPEQVESLVAYLDRAEFKGVPKPPAPANPAK